MLDLPSAIVFILALILVGGAGYILAYRGLVKEIRKNSEGWSVQKNNHTIPNQSNILDQEKNTVLELSQFEEVYQKELERSAANFEARLNQTLTNLQASMVQNLNQVQKSHGQFLSNLEEMALTEQKNSQERVSTKINEMLLNFEQNLTSFLSSSEQKSLEAINLEVRSARQLIDNYKAQQLAIIDENIVSVLEKTLELVLKEKLTLRNQIDLVYDALEKAKVEKFFV